MHTTFNPAVSHIPTIFSFQPTFDIQTDNQAEHPDLRGHQMDDGGRDNHNEDQQAVAATLAGDLDAFNSLVVKYERVAYHVAYRILHTEEGAADAVQESMLKAYRALPSFRNGVFKSWLLRIVVNTCYDMLRAARRYRLEELADEPDHAEDAQPQHQLVDSHESPQAFVERMEMHAWLESALHALPQDYRLALVLRDVHGYSYEEIAEITGAPLGTIKSRINRARIRMRDLLAPRLAFMSIH